MAEKPSEVQLAPASRRHVLTVEERRRGALAAAARKRQKREELESRVAAFLAEELLASLRVYGEIRDDPEQPAGARIAAADRIVERALGKRGGLPGLDEQPVTIVVESCFGREGRESGDGASDVG